MIDDLVHEPVRESTDAASAAEHAYFAGALRREMRDPTAEDQKRVHAKRQRQAKAERSNLGLGHDIAAELPRALDEPDPRETSVRSPAGPEATRSHDAPARRGRAAPSRSASGDEQTYERFTSFRIAHATRHRNTKVEARNH